MSCPNHPMLRQPWAWHINYSTHNSLITLFRTFKLIISTGIRIYVSVCACVCVCNCLMSRCYLPPVHSHPRRGSVHSSHRSQSTRRRLLHSHASPPASLDALPDPSRIWWRLARERETARKTEGDCNESNTQKMNFSLLNMHMASRLPCSLGTHADFQ